MIKRDLFVGRTDWNQITIVLVKVFSPIIQHLSKVTRTGIRVVGVNSSEILIEGKKIFFEFAGNSGYPSSS